MKSDEPNISNDVFPDKTFKTIQENINEKVVQKIAISKTLDNNETTQDREVEKIQEILLKTYNEYKGNIDKIFPGNKILNDNYSKLVSILDNDNMFLKEPKVQMEFINNALMKLFDEVEEKPKLFTLYADYLHHVK
jgi:hypothetical protein